MKKAFILSLTLHVLVFMLMYFGMPNPFKRVIKDDCMMVVDFALPSNKTTAPIISPDIPDEKPDPKTPLEVDEKAPQKEEKKELQEEIVEEKAATKTDLEPKIQEDPKRQEPKKEEVEPKKEETPSKDQDALNIDKKDKEKAKKEEKKDDKKQKEEKKKDDLKDKKKKDAEKLNKKQDGEKKATVNLDNKDKKNVKSDKKSDKKKKQSLDDLLNEKTDKKKGKKSKSGAQAEEVSDAFTASEIAILRSHISKCWNVHAGSKGAKEHVVDVEIHLNEDGMVKKAEVVDKERMKSDPFYRVAAETAQRSLLDPECNPLPIPHSDYEKWKEITFRFDPKDMF
ncbi:MAG: cell envelope integrity protein TolA [Proteobacteria bacterium]|nr:cell envelope integrity protein TolA [Pseudomonadota bacterium]